MSAPSRAACRRLGLAPALAAGIALWTLAACDPDPPSNRDLDAGETLDAALADLPEADVADSALDPDPEVVDAAPEADPVQRVRLRLEEGEVIEGEPVTSYDRRLWWDAADEEYLAIFQHERFAPWPDDRSMRFVPSSAVVETQEIPSEGATPYHLALRRASILLARSPLEGAAHVITAGERYHLEENGFGDHAWDLVLTDDQGARYVNDGARNEDYRVWGAEVTLPTRGVVVEVVREGVDNLPGDHPGLEAVNNLVGVHVGGAFYLYLLHFQQGGIYDHVQVGVELAAGAPLGRVGNSGVSLEPHLHVALIWFDEGGDPPRGWGVPAEFKDLHVAPSPAGPSALYPFFAPPSGVWISGAPF